MRKTILAATAAIGLASLSVVGLNAQGPAPASVDPTAAESGSYTADASHSMVGWQISHLGFNDYYGIFGDVAGTLNLDTADITKSMVDVTIPIASVTVPSEGLKDHFFRPSADGGDADFWGPDPAPARFVSTAVHSTGDNTAHIMGNLTMNGETAPVTIEAELVGMGANPMSQKKTLGFHGRAMIKRSDYGINFGIPFGIPDEVPLMITVAFEKDA